MLHILIKILLCFSVSNAYSASLINCSISSSPIIENGRKNSNNTKVCFIEQNTNRFYISESCKYEDCLALEKQKVFLDFNNFITEVGKPGFKLCKALGGKPSLVNLAIFQNKLHTDKCTFKDESFVSTDYLIEVYRSK